MIVLLTACLFFAILVRALNCISKSTRENCVRPPYKLFVFFVDFLLIADSQQAGSRSSTVYPMLSSGKPSLTSTLSSLPSKRSTLSPSTNEFSLSSKPSTISPFTTKKSSLSSEPLAFRSSSAVSLLSTEPARIRPSLSGSSSFTKAPLPSSVLPGNVYLPSFFIII